MTDTVAIEVELFCADCQRQLEVKSTDTTTPIFIHVYACETCKDLAAEEAAEQAREEITA